MKIVVTGYGIISAIGKNAQETLISLKEEKSGIDKMKILESKHNFLPIGEIPFNNDSLKTQLNIPAGEPISRTSLLGIKAAREALTHANITDTSKLAFLSGTTVGGMDTTEQHFTDWASEKNMEYIHLHEAGNSTTKIAKYLGDFAYMTTPSTACSSALNSIIFGVNLILSGKVQQVLAGGSECLTKFHLNGFNSLMILDKEKCKPFDKNRAGLNLGEGAAYLVIESEDSAINRGANIIAYISGFANTCDAYHQTATSPNGDGPFSAMSSALSMAELISSDIDYINTHGTGTQNNDQSESTAMIRLFNEKMPYISSTKSFTGHTTSASGGIESVISLLALENNFVPANIRWTTQDDNTITPVKQTLKCNLNNVLCNSFGFGGNCSSIIFSKSNPNISLPSPKDINYSILASVELTENVDYKPYISVLEARRLTPQMRQTLVAAKQAMLQSGLTNVDAIITGSRWGCMINSVKFLSNMLESNEQSLNPTHFMQSTHNTMSSIIAIHLDCHAYNNTYSHGLDSFNDALLDAKTQMQLGLIKSALIIGFDEVDNTWQSHLAKINDAMTNVAKAIVISVN